MSDLWARIEHLRRFPTLHVPAHLRMSAEQIRAEIATLSPADRDRMNTEIDEIYRRLRREQNRRSPEDTGAIFTAIAGFGAVLASPFVDAASDDLFLTGMMLLVVTIIGWVIARHFRYRR